MQITTAFSDEKEQEEQQVSDNILVIEISGPDLFSMEIVDTPGLSSSESHFRGICVVPKLTYIGPSVDDTQEVTRSLIMDLIKQPNTIILLVLPFTV